MAFLHTHAHSQSGHLSAAFEQIVLHGLLDTLKLLPFLLLTYILMEFIEHKASDKVYGFMRRAGTSGPFIGGALGVLPQCGFSAAASNLYAGRVISVGTLIAVFLSTSDEMLPIMMSGGIPPASIATILIYKCIVGILVGFFIDFLFRIFSKSKRDINIDAICDEDNCHCERGIFYSAVHHTLTISAFVLIITLIINSLVYFIGSDVIASIIYDKPVIGHLIAAVFGLIPNCAASVALTSLYTEGMITAGTMMAGLFSGAGVGLLVLFKVNKAIKENLCIILALLVAGVVFGLIFDLAFSSLLA